MQGATHKSVVLGAGFSVLLAACGGGGSGNSGSSVLHVPAAPAISTQPTDAQVITGSAAVFSVSATGTDITYQWKKNGADISGATGASYTTAAATATDDGTAYTVTVNNAGGNVTSATVHLKLKPSDNQQAFENLALAPAGGSFSLHWNLSASGGQVSGTNYAYSDYSLLATSPLIGGSQAVVQSAPRNLSGLLALPSPAPDRLLVQGAVLLVPGSGAASKITYVGSDIRVDTLASDNRTVAYSTLRSNYATVSLTGTMGTTPVELAHLYNTFFSNPLALNAAGSWATGSAYVKFTETNIGDRYKAYDCKASTTTAQISACASGMTLNTLLTPGFSSSSDGTTYHLSDGTVSTVGGINVWVATAPRPVSATVSATTEYRIYFEMGGNVYTGALIKDGVALTGGSYTSNPGGATVADRLTFLPYFIRLNKAAHDSLASAVQF